VKSHRDHHGRGKCAPSTCGGPARSSNSSPPKVSTPARCTTRRMKRRRGPRRPGCRRRRAGEPLRRTSRSRISLIGRKVGEDPYKSFLGVPIVRGGQVFGVLTVQKPRRGPLCRGRGRGAPDRRPWVLAEVVAQGNVLQSGRTRRNRNCGADRPLAIRGGRDCLRVLRSAWVVLHEPRVRVERMIARQSAGKSSNGWKTPSNRLRASVDEMLESSELDLTGRGTWRSSKPTVSSRMTAAGARRHAQRCGADGLNVQKRRFERVQDDTRLRMKPVGRSDSCADRAHDLDDLARRLLRPSDRRSRREGRCRICRRMPWVAGARKHGAGGTARLCARPARGAGDRGRRHHVAMWRIVAARWAFRSWAMWKAFPTPHAPGNTIVIDGETGEVHLRPMPDIVAAVRRANGTLRASRVARFARGCAIFLR